MVESFTLDLKIEMMIDKEARADTEPVSIGVTMRVISPAVLPVRMMDY